MHVYQSKVKGFLFQTVLELLFCANLLALCRDDDVDLITVSIDTSREKLNRFQGGVGP